MEISKHYKSVLFFQRHLFISISQSVSKATLGQCAKNTVSGRCLSPLRLEGQRKKAGAHHSASTCFIGGRARENGICGVGEWGHPAWGQKLKFWAWDPTPPSHVEAEPIGETSPTRLPTSQGSWGEDAANTEPSRTTEGGSAQQPRLLTRPPGAQQAMAVIERRSWL